MSFPVEESAAQRSQMAKFLALALRGKWSRTEVPAKGSAAVAGEMVGLGTGLAVWSDGERWAST